MQNYFVVAIFVQLCLFYMYHFQFLIDELVMDLVDGDLEEGLGERPDERPNGVGAHPVASEPFEPRRRRYLYLYICT